MIYFNSQFSNKIKKMPTVIIVGNYFVEGDKASKFL